MTAAYLAVAAVLAVFVGIVVRAFLAGAGHDEPGDETADQPESVRSYLAHPQCPCCGRRLGLPPVSYWSICTCCREVVCPSCIERDVCSDCGGAA